MFLKNYRLLLKQEGSNLLILQEGQYKDSIWVPKITIQEKYSLVFGIKFSDEMFQNKTDIQFYTSKDQKFFINSNDSPNSNKELKIYSFFWGAFPDILDLKPALVDLKYESSSEVKNIPIEEIDNYEDFEPGIYSFQYDNKIEKLLFGLISIIFLMVMFLLVYSKMIKTFLIIIFKIEKFILNIS